VVVVGGPLGDRARVAGAFGDLRNCCLITATLVWRKGQGIGDWAGL
jgi:hypothetical protein